MPSGEPPAPQPNEPDPQNEPTVKDQLMRTFSAVRTRLRAATSGGEDDFDDATDRSGGNGEVGGPEVGGNGDGDAHAESGHGVYGGAAPVDPLLAAPPGNGDETLVGGDADDGEVEPAPRSRVAEAEELQAGEAFTEPPGPHELDTELVPLPVPLPVAGFDDDETTATTPRAQAQRSRRRRARPALPILRRRPRVRKVTRIVRRVDAWGIFKISLIFYVVLYIILLVAGVLLWNLANTTGTVANVEGFIRDLFGLKTFEFDGEKLFRASWVLGAVLVVAGTGINVTLAILFNLISDLVGGVRVTVLEEEVVLRQRPLLPREMAPPVEPEAVAVPVEPRAAPPAKPLDEPVDATDPAEALDASDPLLAETPRRVRATSRRGRPRPEGNGTTPDMAPSEVGATAGAEPSSSPPPEDG